MLTAGICAKNLVSSGDEDLLLDTARKMQDQHVVAAPVQERDGMVVPVAMFTAGGPIPTTQDP